MTLLNLIIKDLVANFTFNIRAINERPCQIRKGDQSFFTNEKI